MADKPFDRTLVNTLERPASQDINQAQAQADRALREFVDNAYAGRVSIADASNVPPGSTAYAATFIGNGFKVREGIGMEVILAKGLGFQLATSTLTDNINPVTSAPSGTSDLSEMKPLFLSIDQPIPVPASDGANPRKDIVEVRYDRRLENPLSKDIFDTGSGQFASALVNKTLAFIQDGRVSVNGAAGINYKTGTPSGTPSAPSVTAGYYKIAEVLVGTGVLSLTANKIIDIRKLLHPGNTGYLSGRITNLEPVSVTAPVLTDVVAPPGILMTAVNAAASLYGAAGSRTYRLYVFGGNVGAIAPVISVVDLAATPVAAMIVGIAGTGIVNAPIQTLLSGPQANPPLQIALDQEFAFFDFTAYNITGGAFASGMAAFAFNVALSAG